MKDSIFRVTLSAYNDPISSLDLPEGSSSIINDSDVLKAIQLLPQVQSRLEGSTDLFVRGSENSQNLVMIDGVLVYNLSHTYGIFSAIDPQAVKSLDFYPGVAPAQYNSRLSSFIDIGLKEGDMEEYHGGMSLGLIFFTPVA